MGKKTYNYNLVKPGHIYIVNEIADRFGVHKNTVLSWIKQGLKTSDGIKRYLIRGHDLRDFLQAKRKKHKCICQLDEIYCVKCRAAKKPAGMMADYKPPAKGLLGSIMGMCPDCECMIYRRTSPKRLEQIRQYLQITIPMGNQQLGNTNQPIVNSDFNQGAKP